MQSPRRILCPIDFSEASAAALDAAVALARLYGAQVRVLHVLPDPVTSAVPPWTALTPYLVPIPADTKEKVLSSARDFAKKASQEWVLDDVEIAEGDPAGKIVERAEALGVLMIVLGTHGLSGFERLVLGSVAEKVLRRAGCPVLTVPRPLAEGTHGSPFGTVLCPVDLSPVSSKAIETAASIAGASKARLVVLHAVEQFPDGPEPDELGHFNIPEYRRMVTQKAAEGLHALVPDEVRRNVPTDEVITGGKAWRAVLDAVKGHGASIIVMGVTARSPIDLLVFGSTTNQVVRHADVPVMTVKG
jgi:nucleotide-binding universal stress UspA family protein